MNFRQIVTVFGDNVAVSGNSTVAENGDKVLPFRAIFVAVFGDYSFGNNLLLFSATFVAWCGQAISRPYRNCIVLLHAV